MLSFKLRNLDFEFSNLGYRLAPMMKTYMMIYFWGILVNICLIFILVILKNEYKSSVYKRNLGLLKKLNLVKKESTLSFAKKIFFFLAVLLSWIYTSFLSLLLFVRIFGKQLSEYDDVYLNCLTIFSKEELSFNQALIIYLLILNKEVLYSRAKAEEYILKFSENNNFQIPLKQIREVFTVVDF